MRGAIESKNIKKEELLKLFKHMKLFEQWY